MSKEIEIHVEEPTLGFHDLFEGLQGNQLKFLEGMAANMLNAVRAQEWSGVSRMNHYNWISKQDDTYIKALEHLKKEMVNAIESKAYEMALSGDTPSMSIFALKAKAGWSDGNVVGTVADEKPTINISLVQPTKTDDES